MKEINKLLEKYWNAETTLEEEKLIKTHFRLNSKTEKDSELDSLFAFFENEKEIKYKGDISIPKHSKKSPGLVKMHILKKIAVAASILFVLAIGGFLGRDYLTETNNHIAKNEIKDPDKARRIAEDALAMLASNYIKGEQTLSKSIKSFEKLKIINSLIKSN